MPRHSKSLERDCRPGLSLSGSFQAGSVISSLMSICLRLLLAHHHNVSAVEVAHINTQGFITFRYDR